MQWAVKRGNATFVVGLCLLLTGLPAVGQKSLVATGSICGTVQDESGDPAVTAKVTANYQNHPHLGMRPWSSTDDAGLYCIENVTTGEYLMSAEDPLKGYPNMDISFFSDVYPPPRPRVHVTAKEPKAEAHWRIPFKSGIVEVVLSDARTGKAIETMFFVTLMLESNPTRFVHGSAWSSTPLLLPPNENVHLTVGLTGYREWPGDGSKGGC
jgi:hypothetical protein